MSKKKLIIKPGSYNKGRKNELKNRIVSKYKNYLINSKCCVLRFSSELSFANYQPRNKPSRRSSGLKFILKLSYFHGFRCKMKCTFRERKAVYIGIEYLELLCFKTACRYYIFGRGVGLNGCVLSLCQRISRGVELYVGLTCIGVVQQEIHNTEKQREFTSEDQHQKS